MMPSLEFDEKNHIYTLSGRKLSSVTEVLEIVLRTSSPWWKPSHRMRGQFLHKICEAIDAKDYDPAGTVFPKSWSEADRDAVSRRAEAYQTFVDSVGYEVIFSELQVYSEELGLAGTLDSIGRQTKGAFAGRFTLVDVKSGEPTPAALLQVSLYDQLRTKHFQNPGDCVRCILHCQPNGKPRPVFRYGIEAKQDDADARAVVRTFRFMQQHGLINSNKRG
jgi:hypothetical protein